jgi:AcrR family transcriptional regulator
MTRKAPVKRPYRQQRRAEQMAATRQRIVAATVELHSSIGPARTTFSMIAERAGVQRHTLYAHFPDERDLHLACSGLFMECDPLPDPASWREIVPPRKRLKTGLRAIYDWFGRNAGALAAILRDAEVHELTREIVALRQGRAIALYHDILGEGLDARQRAMLHLGLSFFTWRALVAESGMSPDEASAAMSEAITGKR